MDSIMVGTVMPTILASLGGIGGYGWEVGALTGASLRSLLLGASFAQGLAIVLALASILMAWRFFRSQRPAAGKGGEAG